MTRLDKEKLFAQVGYRPHAGQLEIHLSPAKRRIVACGVRWGKSTAAVHEALAAVLAPTGPSRGWLVSPTFDTSDLILKTLFGILETRFAHRMVSIDRRRRCAVLTNLAGNVAEVSAKSASRPATLLGESLDWVILDEAARLKPEIWREHLSQRLVDRDGWALLASTPHKGGEWFKEEFDRCANGDDDFAAWTRPTWDNPAIDRAVIGAEKGRLGVDEFYQEYGGEFIAPGGRICPVCRWWGARRRENPDGRAVGRLRGLS